MLLCSLLQPVDMRGTSAERRRDMSMFRREGLGSPVPERLRAPREPTTLELRERFSALFAHLGREEEMLKTLMSQNDMDERQLQDLRHSSNASNPSKYAEILRASVLQRFFRIKHNITK